MDNHQNQPPQANQSIAYKMERFETICQQRKQRVTPLRRNVLSTILKTPNRLKAYDIIAILSTPSKKVKPPVVYRTLDFLIEQRFVHRIESDNSYAERENPEQPGHHCMLAVCQSCGHVKEFSDNSLSRIIQLNVHNVGYKMSAGTLEVAGTCPNCIKKQTKVKS